MKSLAIAIGITATVAYVTPALAFEAGNTEGQFKAIATMPTSEQPTDKDMLTDNELAAVEGAAPVGQVGLVNANVQNVLNENNVEFLQNVRVLNNANVAVLSAGQQNVHP